MVAEADGRMKFRVATATLVFHEVSDLRIEIDFVAAGLRHNLNELAIASIDRRPVESEAGIAKRDHERWRIELNLPRGGAISFTSSGYDLTLRAPSQLLGEQRLPADERPPLYTHQF
jgi:hypothetical protein